MSAWNQIPKGLHLRTFSWFEPRKCQPGIWYPNSNQAKASSIHAEWNTSRIPHRLLPAQFAYWSHYLFHLTARFDSRDYHLWLLNHLGTWSELKCWLYCRRSKMRREQARASTAGTEDLLSFSISVPIGVCPWYCFFLSGLLLFQGPYHLLL